MSNSRKIRNSALLVALALVLGLGLPGCASTTDPSSQGGTAPSAGTGDAAFKAPHFSGPWAEGFTSSYRDAHSEFERGVLKDGKITDAEFDEMQNRMATCLSDKGIVFTRFKSDGSFDFQLAKGMKSAVGNAIADKCSASSGFNTIGFLYFGMQRNPQNLANDAIISQCLVKKGAVPSGYSAKDFDADSPDSTFPFKNKKTGPQVLVECSADPLGTLASN